MACDGCVQEQVDVWAASSSHVGVAIRVAYGAAMDGEALACSHLASSSLSGALDCASSFVASTSRGDIDPEWAMLRRSPGDPGGASLHVEMPGGGAGQARERSSCYDRVVAAVDGAGFAGLGAGPLPASGPCLSDPSEGPRVCLDAFLGRLTLRSDMLRAAAMATPCGPSVGAAALFASPAFMDKADYANLRVASSAHPGLDSRPGRWEVTVEVTGIFPNEFDVAHALSSLAAPSQDFAQSLLPRVIDTSPLLGCPLASSSRLRLAMGCRGLQEAAQHATSAPRLSCVGTLYDFPLYPGARLLGEAHADPVLVGGVRVHQYLLRDGANLATVALDIVADAPFPPGASLCVRQTFPWNINPRLFTLGASLGHADPETREVVVAGAWTAAKWGLSVSQGDPHGPAVLESAASAHGGSPVGHLSRAPSHVRRGAHSLVACMAAGAAAGRDVARFHVTVEKLPISLEETPADMARGYEVPPATVVLFEHPAWQQGPGLCRHPSTRVLRSNLLLVGQPYGDYSMLFNVPVMASLASMALIMLVVSGMGRHFGTRADSGGMSWVRLLAMAGVLGGCGVILLYENTDLQKMLGVQDYFV